MNRSNLEHAVIALLIQLPFGLSALLSGAIGLSWMVAVGWVVGAAVGATWFIAREVTQAEYRWIDQFGGGQRANLPWWGMFDPRVWTHLDSWLDWVAPTVAVTAVAAVAVLFV
jgi:hypothetical protein